MPLCSGLQERYRENVILYAYFSVHSDISFQILKAGGMSGLEDELMQHVMDVVLTTASQLQRWSGVVEPMEAKIYFCRGAAQVFTASTTGTSSYIATCLYYCYQTIHNLNCLCIVQVQTYFRTDTEYQKKAAFCVMVPNMSESLKERIKR